MPNSLGALVCARPFWVSRFLWVAAALLIDLHTVGATETLHPWERKTFSIGTLNGSLILETYGPLHAVRGMLSSSASPPVGFYVSLVSGQSYQLSVTDPETLHVHWLEFFRDRERTLLINGDDEAWQ
jgi:hypothetical protein